MSDAASILYGTTATSAETPPATSATPSVADVLYGPAKAYTGDTNAPEAIRAERKADGARALYSPQAAFKFALPDDAVSGADVPAWREVAADVGASPEDAAEFVRLVSQPADDEQRAQWAAESKALNIAPADLQAARAFVARDPRLFELLDATGLGSHPRVVARVVSLARAARLK
jgi:hypothetical protein